MASWSNLSSVSSSMASSLESLEADGTVSGKSDRSLNWFWKPNNRELGLTTKQSKLDLSMIFTIMGHLLQISQLHFLLKVTEVKKMLQNLPYS